MEYQNTPPSLFMSYTLKFNYQPNIKTQSLRYYKGSHRWLGRFMSYSLKFNYQFNIKTQLFKVL